MGIRYAHPAKLQTFPQISTTNMIFNPTMATNRFNLEVQHGVATEWEQPLSTVVKDNKNY